MKKLIPILIILLLVGCKTKQKFVEREAVKIERVQETKKDSTVQKDIKTDSIVEKATNTIKITKNTDIELTQADPNKTIILEDSEGKQTKITGANAVIKTRSQLEQTKDTTSIALSKSDKSKTDKSETSKTNESIDTKKRSTETDITSTSTFVNIGIGFGILLLIILLLWWLRKRLML